MLPANLAVPSDNSLNEAILAELHSQWISQCVLHNEDSPFLLSFFASSLTKHLI